MIDGMARIGRVIDHVIDKFIGLILETRKGYNQTVFLYNASGDDSVPCVKDRVLIIHIDGTGNYIGGGVLTESQGAKPGEKIFFARDADGKIVSKISMLNDGSINGEADGDATLKTKENLKVEVEKDTTLTFKGDMTLDVTGDIKRTSKKGINEEATDSYTIKAKQIEIIGAMEIILKTIGSALWKPNGCDVCYICGAPYAGPAMGITGLKGS
jgi:hypothetical protein